MADENEDAQELAVIEGPGRMPVAQHIGEGPPAIASRELTRPQTELIKRTIAKGATDDELKLFIANCNRTGLDPFARQIWAIKRRERGDDGTFREAVVTMVSIDGLRLIAQRSGQYAGQRGPFWAGSDGEWREDGKGRPMPWLDEETPAAAMVEVLRHDFNEPLVGIARFKSFAQTKRDGGLRATWASMPDLMIAKCAEALALRRAFPHETSGLFIAEEVGADDIQEVDGGEQAPKTIASDKATELEQACASLFKRGAGFEGWEPEAVLKQATVTFGRQIDSFEALLPEEAAKISAAISQQVKKPKPKAPAE